MDGYNCTAVAPLSDFIVRCTLPATMGSLGVVRLHTRWGKTYSSAPGILQFVAPAVVSVHVSPAQVTNMLGMRYNMSIHGKHFGVARNGNGTDIQVIASGSACPRVRVFNDTFMECLGLEPPWTPGDNSVRLLLNGRTAVAPDAFQFQQRVEVLAVSPTIIAVEGGWIEIEGQGLGMRDNDIQQVLAGPYECTQVTVVVPATKLRCMMSPGVGSGHKVQAIMAQNGRGAVESAPELSYAAPSILSTSLVRAQSNHSGPWYNQSFPRAVAYLGETQLQLELQVWNAGWDACQLDSISDSNDTVSDGQIRLAGPGWVEWCRNVTIGAAQVAAGNASTLMTSRIQCIISSVEAASASMKSDAAALQVAYISFSVAGQPVSGSLQNARPQELLLSPAVNGGAIVLSGLPMVDILTPQVFHTNGTAGAVNGRAALRAQTAL